VLHDETLVKRRVDPAFGQDVAVLMWICEACEKLANCLWVDGVAIDARRFRSRPASPMAKSRRHKADETSGKPAQALIEQMYRRGWPMRLGSSRHCESCRHRCSDRRGDAEGARLCARLPGP